MNCKDALRQLESARPSSDDLRDPELAPASDHLDGCTSCRELFLSRQSLDRRIGRVMRDVPVPAGLRDRLLQSLGEPITPQSQPAATAAKETSQRVAQSRRKWLHAMAGVSLGAAALITGVVLLLTGDPPPDPRLTMESLRNDTTLDVDALPAFNGAFSPRPPGGLWKQRLSVDESARGDLPGKDGKHRVAVYGYTVLGRDGRTMYRGLILAVPTASLQDPPSGTAVNTRRTDVYVRRSTGNFHMLSWQSKENGLTYVCFVPAGGDAMDALQRALTPPAA